MRNGRSVQAIKFVERAVDGCVGYEVVDVVVFGGESLGLVYERR